MLKVSRSFVSRVGRSAGDTAVVSGVLGLAHALGLATVGEGVESADQALLLAGMGCDFAQGHHWSPPLPPDELSAWLEQGGGAGEPPPPATVVVVDDDHGVRAALRASLELDGAFRVVAEAEDAAGGIRLARLHQPDLVLLDLAMPGMSGREALPHVHEAAPSTKVVVVTSSDREGALAEGGLDGIDGFVEKGGGLDAAPRLLADLVRSESAGPSAA